MENIDWNKIRTAHGTAEHIPYSLEKLKSKIFDERKDGYWELDNYVVLQSDLYEAAYYIIEPLIEMLNETIEKDFILKLLIEISMGYAPEEIKINGIENNLQDACDKLLKSKITELEIIREKTIDKKYKNKIEELVNIIKEK
jgi:hypothetical protein